MKIEHRATHFKIVDLLKFDEADLKRTLVGSSLAAINDEKIGPARLIESVQITNIPELPSLTFEVWINDNMVGIEIPAEGPGLNSPCVTIIKHDPI